MNRIVLVSNPEGFKAVYVNGQRVEQGTGESILMKQFESFPFEIERREVRGYKEYEQRGRTLGIVPTENGYYVTHFPQVLTDTFEDVNTNPREDVNRLHERKKAQENIPAHMVNIQKMMQLKSDVLSPVQEPFTQMSHAHRMLMHSGADESMKGYINAIGWRMFFALAYGNTDFHFSLPPEAVYRSYRVKGVK